ncbi:MAG: response regulator [Deltaproteobacteria bacterium]|nr:response regulator [Deltaproteobacteria bacterium]
MSQAKTRSEEESLQKSSFLARMSHEIRTPLNAVLGMCELARRSLGKPEAAEYLAGIRRAGGDLLTIINDILDFSRISARSSEFNVAPYSTSSMLCDALVFLKIRMEGNHVGFKAAASPSLPSRLLGDEVRVRQVLTNLLSNAAKYTRRGSISLDVGCSEEAQGRVRLSFRVADTGIGIRREDMDSLFGEFVRLEQGGVRHIEGTGLGLSITRSLCRAMGGDVSVESEYGKGSVFTAEVVQGVADPTPMGSLEEEARPGEEWSPDRPDAAPFTAPGFRVLIVDDIETNLLVAKGLLEPYGMDVEVSLIPSQAVELCESVPFDLLFIDHMMPEMDGAQTMERIRGLGERWKSVPIVVLTAAVMAGMKEMFLSKGFDAFLGKPIVFSELALILDRFVPQSRRVAPSEARAAGSSTRAGEGISIQGIDAISGLRRMGGKRADYIKALTVFRRDLEERSQALGAVEQGGLEAFRIQVHAVKSAAANVGALGLSEEAALLEEASSRGDLAGVRTRLPRLTARLASITAAIAGALRRESETAAPPAHDPPPAAGPAPAPAGAPAAPAGTPAAPAAGDYGRSPALGNGDGAPLPPDGGPADPGAPVAAKPVAQAGAPAGGNGGGPGVFPRLNVERGLLLDLRQALAKRDVREIDRLLEGIGSAATDPGTREAVEQISTRVLMADYDEAEFLVAKSIG